MTTDAEVHELELHDLVPQPARVHEYQTTRGWVMRFVYTPLGECDTCSATCAVCNGIHCSCCGLDTMPLLIVAHGLGGRVLCGVCLGCRAVHGRCWPHGGRELVGDDECSRGIELGSAREGQEMIH